MDKPILFLNNAAQSESFTTTQGGGGGGIDLPPRNRIAHASWLTQRFDEEWHKLNEYRQQRNAQAIPSRGGSYLEVRGQAGHELAVNGLENRRSRIGSRLISTQTVVTDKGAEMRSIVYVPSGQEKKYIQKIKDYATKIDARWNQFKNKALVESIEDVKLALLENLWQDPLKNLPGDIPVWCELWLRTENGSASAVVDRIHNICQELSIETNNELLNFPERSIIVIQANRNHLKELFERSDDLAELRLAKEPVSFWSSMSNYEQTEAVSDLLKRISYDDKGVSVCVLDSGINNGHQLLEQFCSDNELEVYHPDWRKNDHDGHGTQMAGVVMYGDLSEALESRDIIKINHRVSSGKILPPPNFPDNDKRLYGEITAQTISKCEIKIPDRTQLYCMAVTTKYETDHGRPSSWSAAIDSLCSGQMDGVRRLFLISAGNAANLISKDELTEYPDINKRLESQNPAQAWNAITIGAYTEKTRITDLDYEGYSPLAQSGELSPHSTTSLGWDHNKWPNKPDIVLEGGNLLKSPNGEIDTCDDLCILTASKSPIIKQFELFNATSAATAKAAWMTAKIQSIIPNAWPETIRALMVHSAEWTPQLIQQFGIDISKKGDVGTLLRVAGYGVPNLEKASTCATNHLTLIVQEKIRPFNKDGSTNEMHFYKLPWPQEALQELGDRLVTVKITLSYFIEPSPGELQTQSRYTYASHGLRFEMNTSEEYDNIKSFKKRINKEARENKEDKPESKGFGEKWKIGLTYRSLGTVHSDSITLPGIQMADCCHIAIFPIGGWWKTRKSEKCMEKETRYSLIVSLHTEAQDIDIYTPVANMIAVPITI